MIGWSGEIWLEKMFPFVASSSAKSILESDEKNNNGN